jgi:N-dimethylarginine dimethylaminohydrolase
MLTLTGTFRASKNIRSASNVINISDNTLTHASSGSVANRLRAEGYTVSEFPLGEFLKGGGAAKSLVLRLNDL